MDDALIDEIIRVLIGAGWEVKPNNRESIERYIPTQYTTLPKLLERFLLCFELCVSPNEKTWFLTNSDFKDANDSIFAWNEWEKLSLEATNDAETVIRIKQFWQNHLPILLSVQSSYSYLACCLEENRFGRIVYGREPEFEEVEEIAGSFDEFLGQLLDFYTGKISNSYIREIL